jgi:hypothetical protein
MPSLDAALIVLAGIALWHRYWGGWGAGYGWHHWHQW